MSFGPDPWQQTQWDWRAAGNFVCGGAGAGVLLFTLLSGAQGLALALALLCGLALVGTGLLCVWLEIGRPLRALHVYFNPRTSWMSREAFVAALLMPATLGAAADLPGCDWLAGALALAFVYCQSRMLQAARGIPAWREPLLVPLVLLTGLVEGGGIWLLLRSPQAAPPLPLCLLLGALLLARWALWLAYRRRLAGRGAPSAQRALDHSGRWLLGGSALALAALALALTLAQGSTLAVALLCLAGFAAAAPGAWFKFILVTRAGFNQGFALVHLPVRGVAR